MYAFVRFLEDDMCYALPVSDVKDFQPVHKRDFDDQKVYVVLRGAGQPAKAHILALAGELRSSLLIYYNNNLINNSNSHATVYNVKSLTDQL